MTQEMKWDTGAETQLIYEQGKQQKQNICVS